MKNFGKAVVKVRHLILIVAMLLLIPAFWGYTHTRINYDMLVYLPSTIETMIGQNILEDEFGTGAIAMLVVEGKDNKTAADLKAKIAEVPHVNDVLWYDSFLDLSIPVEVLPEKIEEAFMQGDSTLMAITFDTTTSDDDTMEAITNIRAICDDQCYLSGTTAVLQDTKELAEGEEPIYVGLAVLLATIVTALSMDTFLAPLLFLASIGMAIVYNLGSNIFMGQISYVTKALAAVLQLGVTMDYSIFLWHSFKELEAETPDDPKGAMAKAINRTLQSVIGSSITTIAGFAALCFMSFSFGLDVGIVMMKGVAIGVVSCVTILPSLILTFEKAIDKTKHKPLMPSLPKLPGWVQKHYKAILIAFCIMWIPAIYGYTHYGVYYNLDSTLPRTLKSIQASEKLRDEFNQSATMMVLSDQSLEAHQTAEMCDAMKQVDGVKSVIGLDAFLGGGIPRELLPERISHKLSSENWKLILVMSEYKTGSEEVNAQIDTLNRVIDQYDTKAMLIGDAPCTKDLVSIANHDFNVVNWTSIAIIFFIIAFVFKSASLPFLLVILIEGAIFINMAVPFYMGEELPFIASIVIGTIQLGSTVDYAILMTSRYQSERRNGVSKKDAVFIAHKTSINSILCSGFTFFAATFGVGLYSNISLISSMCVLMARGALISTGLVITVLPAILMLFDPVIIHTSIGFRPKKEKMPAGTAAAVQE
ncbi:MAG: MMPL family transporter [Lachnospiraceae bacterium]|nr:MMPL family transporter [Lachnospiraceae bacterium]